jgi:hypothetical protein
LAGIGPFPFSCPDEAVGRTSRYEAPRLASRSGNRTNLRYDLTEIAVNRAKSL